MCGDHVWPNCCLGFIEFDVRIIYKKLSRKYKFNERVLGDSPNFFEDVSYCTYIFHNYWLILVNFNTEDLHVMLFTNFDFLENWCSESCSLLGGVNAFYWYFLHFCLIWIKFGTGAVQYNWLNDCGFCESCHICGICSTLSSCIVWFG